MTPRQLAGRAVLLSHHVDGLELTCSVQQLGLLLPEDGDDRLERELADVQVLARSRTPQCAVETDWRWGERDDPVILHPSGKRPGARYCVECCDWIAFIASTSAVTPRITIQCRAEYLLRVGALAAHDEVTEWVEQHLLPLVGGRPVEDEHRWKLARLDLAADVMGVSFNVGRFNRFVSRANVRRMYNDEPVVDE